MLYVLGMRPDITLVSVLDLNCHWIAGGGVLDRLQSKLGRRHRRGIYSFVVVLWLMIWQRLHPRGTMSHAVQLLAQGAGRRLLTACKRVQEDRVSSAPGGYCQAVKRMPKLVPEQVTRELVERLNRELVVPGLPGPVYLVDGSSVPLPHTRKRVRAYPPAPNQHGGGHWPLLRLRARSVAGMEKELLAGICAYNLVRVVMCLAARRVGRASRELSFTRVLDLVTDWRAGLRAGAPEAELTQSIERQMDWAAACLLPRRRKRRSYPRQVWGHGGTFARRKTKRH